jgi:glycosyltransferase involved in cell wall biosynthesis
MNIAIIAGPHLSIPPKQYGGIEQIIWHLIKGLQEAGHTPILLGTGDSEVDCELIPIAPTALHFPRYKKDVPAHQKLVRKAETTTRRMLRQIMHRVDIVHSHGFDMKNYSDIPNVTTLHNLIDLPNFKYYSDRKEMAHVTISKNQQAAFPELHYVGVVYNGENPRDFPIVSSPDNYVCFLGRFDRDKNPHLAIQLALSLGIKIKLAGKIDFAGEDYFEDEVAPLLKNKNVEFLGELDLKSKAELLGNARCNLHPTNFREPFGLTVLEAAYCGTPTLAVARGSMPELIEPERTGILVEDMIEGRHLLQKCFDMDRNYIASRARQLFNYKTMANHYVEIYHSVIQEFSLKNKATRSTFDLQDHKQVIGIIPPKFNRIPDIYTI